MNQQTGWGTGCTQWKADVSKTQMEWTLRHTEVFTHNEGGLHGCHCSHYKYEEYTPNIFTCSGRSRYRSVLSSSCSQGLLSCLFSSISPNSNNQQASQHKPDNDPDHLNNSTIPRLPTKEKKEQLSHLDVWRFYCSPFLNGVDLPRLPVAEFLDIWMVPNILQLSNWNWNLGRPQAFIL